MLILFPLHCRPDYHQYARLGGTAHCTYRTEGHRGSSLIHSLVQFPHSPSFNHSLHHYLKRFNTQQMPKPHSPLVDIMPTPEIWILIIPKHTGNNEKKHSFNLFQTSYLIVIRGKMPDSLTCSGIQTILYQRPTNCSAKSRASLHTAVHFNGVSHIRPR